MFIGGHRCSLVFTGVHWCSDLSVPWVPEPRNLDERKLVRGKERRKKGGSGQLITQPRFGADQRDYESIRSPFAQ